MTQQETERTVPELEINARDHTQGPANARISLIEYGDFQCPHCGEAFPIVKQIQQTLGDNLRFVYRHFPLTSIHPYSEMAAEAAESAGAQNRFWEMHDYLFENQLSLGPELLQTAAADLGLDLARFLYDVNNSIHAERVQQDVISGHRAGVHGTPTFFINGVRHQGSYDFESMIEAIRNSRIGLAA